MLSKFDLYYRCSTWDEEIGEAIVRFKGNSLAAKVGRLEFVVAVYYIWQERNQGLFGSHSKPYPHVVKEMRKKKCTFVLEHGAGRRRDVMKTGLL